MPASKLRSTVHLALPKGRMQSQIFALLSEAGIQLSATTRGYRPQISLPDFETKILKPQNVVEMLQQGSRDIGFAGKDWVEELDADLEELFDTGLDPVSIVAAAPRDLLIDGQLPDRPLLIATEYENITRKWIEARGLKAEIVHARGATEVFPPEDADLIVDNTATGATLRDNGLVIVDQLMNSSTRCFVNRDCFNDSDKRQRIDEFRMLLVAVLEGRRRVMLEVNVAEQDLASLIAALPAMQRPTVSPLYGDSGFAVKAAVLRDELAQTIPRLKMAGGRDLVVSNLRQIVK